MIAALEEHRATWQYWHLWAETQRQLRGAAIDPADTADGRRSRGGGGDHPIRPAHPGRRPGRSAGPSCGGADGASVFTVAGSDPVHLDPDPRR